MISEATNQLRQLGSARQLAKQLNVSRNTLIMWTRGLRCPSEPSRALMFERLGIDPQAWDRPAGALVPISRSRAEGRAAAKAERVEAANAGVTIAIRPHPEGGYTVQVGPHVYRALHASRADVKRTAQRVAARDHRPEPQPEPEQVPVGVSRPGVHRQIVGIDQRGAYS